MEKILEAFIKKAQAEQYVINGVKITEKGETKAFYNRFNDQERLHTFSASKSITSIGVGIAIDEGLLRLDEKIADSFQESIPEDASPYVYEITVEDLLKMTCGLKDPLFFFSTPERYGIKDWVGHFFKAEFAHQPGTNFLYSNFNTYMLSCLIEKKAGVNLASYLEERFFAKLDILSPDWFVCPMGHTTGANGLFLTIDEMSRIGEMLLNQGSYQGHRIVSESYIQAATKNQFVKDWPNQGYGYQFWRGKDGLSYLAAGKYGQMIHVLEEEGLVIAIQALSEKDIESFAWDQLIKPLKNKVNNI
ncbi:serine hydrolase domain-containing protein [Vagococcus salmoninarum]|uniref:serine hydrolase domain-containing protein n=1 Tax=Vagococcus salmoninarum TaxID=2739 RepID=UPI001880288B|nr:serine hydrolase [Vagococcus salmoninarum]MBE9387643.1 serine hydrolase [Vagococcus salmoninarum]